MPLAEGQVQVRDLVMGEGTPYEVKEFNPFNRTVRADYVGKNPWSDGGYSGPEFLDVNQVSMKVYVVGNSLANWKVLHWALIRAFDSVGTGPDVEIRWVLDGEEFLQRGRPTVVNPEIRALRAGRIFSLLGYRADDPLIYSGQFNQLELSLTQATGGLQIPQFVPTQYNTVYTGGKGTAVNAGGRPARVLIRFNGPVTNPFVLVGGRALTLNLSISAGHWVDIDTDPNGQTAYYDGLPQASVLSSISGDWPILASGSHEVRYGADSRYHPDATMLFRWRDTY